MCTAITYKTKDTYFGRNLDYEVSYGNKITICPRNYSFKFSNNRIINSHYAIVGMAMVVDNYPLYFDAINEKGLGIAGLNFVNNAYYFNNQTLKDNVPSYELIPWILSQCISVKQARALLEKINITNKVFNDKLPVSSLHWLIADKSECITLESTKEGIKVYDNPVGVLTNNPPFNIQLNGLKKYEKLSACNPLNKVDPKFFSRGMGAIGLPGDLSSQSRFARAVFVKNHSICANDEISSVNQFFHILQSVEQQRGCCNVGNNKYEITLYSSCCNLTKGLYYYTTYDNHQINVVDMNKANLNSTNLICYDLINKENIHNQN